MRRAGISCPTLFDDCDAVTNDEDRNALIPLPSGAIVKAGTGFKRILSGMVSDALDVARSRDRSLTRARFRIGNHEFRDADYRQILLWAEALKLEPAVVVQRLESSSGFANFPFGWATKVEFIVEDGAIVTLVWDFNLLPIHDFAWVDGLAIEEIVFVGAATARLSLDLPRLNRLSCFHIGITELDLSKVPGLASLECEDNRLAELVLSNVPALIELSCSGNQLTELDLSNVPALSSLVCFKNQLTALDLSKTPALTYLDCDSNQLAELDLSHVPALVELSCGDNGLSELDLSSTPALAGLFCGANQFTRLNLSNVPALVELCCRSNQLTHLDLSNVPALTWLLCCCNRLTELDIRHQEKLAFISYDPSVRLKKLPTQNPKTMKND